MAGNSESGIRKTIRKGKPRGRPFGKGNEYAAKPGEVRNPEGKSGATKLSTGYTKLLAMQPPEAMRAKMAAQLGYEPQTWAELIAMSQLLEGAKGEVQAAREIRQATEGDKVHNELTGQISVKRVEDLTDDDLARIAASGSTDDAADSGE